MNVDQLLRILADLPGHLPVVVEDSSSGWMQGTALYLAPAYFDRRISGTFLYEGHQEGPDDCLALVISAFNQSNPDYLEITEPPMWAPTVDAECDVPQAPAGSAGEVVRCEGISPSSVNQRRGARQ